jgi:hypothetical protein
MQQMIEPPWPGMVGPTTHHWWVVDSGGMHGTDHQPLAYVLPPRVYIFVFLPNPANCRKRNFGRNFANSERKENSNSKNEISVNSDRNFGDFDRNFGDFDRKMMSVVIFLLFPRSNEKLLNTNFVQFFEIYNFCFRNFFI